MLADPCLGDPASGGGIGLIGQPMIDRRPPGRPGTGDFAVEDIDQRLGGFLAHHHRKAGGVDRHRVAHLLATRQGRWAGRTEDVDLARAHGRHRVAKGDRLVTDL